MHPILLTLALLTAQVPEPGDSAVPILIDGEPARDLQVSFIAGDDVVRLEPSTEGLTIALEDLAGLIDTVIVAASDGQRRCAAYLNGAEHAAGKPIQLYWEGNDPDAAGFAERIEWIGTSPEPRRHDGFPGRANPVSPNVTGRVLDLEGHAVPGAHVVAYPRWAWPNHPKSTFTDSTGSFRFHLPNARAVEVRAFGGSRAGIARQSRTDETAPTFLPMEVTLNLAPWSEETVRVLDLSREPVAGVRVCVGWSPSTCSVLTDQDGLATLPMRTAPPWTGGTVAGWGSAVDEASVRPMDRSTLPITLSVRRASTRQDFLDLTLDPSATRASSPAPSWRARAQRRALCEKILAVPTSNDQATAMRIVRLARLDEAAARKAFAEWPWQDHPLEAKAYYSLPGHPGGAIPDGLEPLTRRLAYATAAWLVPNGWGRPVRAESARGLANQTTEELIARSKPRTPADAPEIDAWTRALATHIPWEANAIRRRLGWRSATRPRASSPSPMTTGDARRMIQNGSFQAKRDLPRVMAASSASIESRLAFLVDPQWEAMTAPHWLALRQLAREIDQVEEEHAIHSDDSDDTGFWAPITAAWAATTAADRAALETALEECVRRTDLFAFGDDARATRAAALAAMRLIRADLARELEPITTGELFAQVKRTLEGSPDPWFALESDLLEASLEVLAATSLDELGRWINSVAFATVESSRFALFDALWVE